mmetsp:Transcript_34127/g.72715  ORF Transcript_34127/g.72715 Transcript_34127/m.72715 type:complete len:510 (+) Transcript_34127:129-1658(+)
MFSLATGIYQSYFAPPKLSILIIGLDGSGKTSLLERIKVTDIDARLDVDDATTKAPLHASYAKGAVAIASGYQDNDGVEIVGGQQPHRRQPQSGGQHHDGGKPARLPPPLPPEQALRSRLSVEKVLEHGFSSAAPATTTKEEEENNLLQSVPPPPLLENGNVDEVEIFVEANEKKTPAPSKPTKKKPPLPPRHDSIKNSAATLTPVPETPATKKNSFIELLRCPSPARYSNSALGEEDEEEEYNENPAKDSLEMWSTEYLANYYINYQEGEEFDIKQNRGGGGVRKMFPIDRIRPTLGQNLAKLDLCGCKCSLFDLSGAEKMRPLWERYYRDTDAIIYVVNAAETSLSELLRSRYAFEEVCQNDALSRRVHCGLPILIFANQLDVAYKEYGASMEKANNEKKGRGISWNDDEEDDFVGGLLPLASKDSEDSGGISKRAVDFHDLVELFGFRQSHSLGDDKQKGGNTTLVGLGNVFLFGGSAKSGEGVRAAMECLIAHGKSYHLTRHAQR